MIDFKELKTLIQKASISNKTNINDMFSFEIDADKLEELLNKRCDLHVLKLNDNIKSKKPGVDDYSLISEYIYKKEAFDAIFDGSSQITSFIIYCDKDGTADIPGFTPEDIRNFNTFEDSKKIEVANFIISELPVYRTLVIRRFNIREEKFDYLIYFRSNRVMINYIKSLKEEGQFETNSGDVEILTASSEAPEEVELPKEVLE